MLAPTLRGAGVLGPSQLSKGTSLLPLVFLSAVDAKRRNGVGSTLDGRPCRGQSSQAPTHRSQYGTLCIFSTSFGATGSPVAVHLPLPVLMHVR